MNQKTVEIHLPGDKSLSHRAAIFSAMAEGESVISNFLRAEDTMNTLRAFESVGVSTKQDDGSIVVHSGGIKTWQAAGITLDMGNSGTGSRLLTGLFSGLDGADVLIDGDESLRKRPMKRITEPLLAAGADIDPQDFLPFRVRGRKLLPIFWKESLGSAQVKSALILAALASNTSLRLEEPKPSRDHTENMLRYAGVFFEKEPVDNGFLIELEPGQKIEPRSWQIWSDASSAAFFVVYGLINRHQVTVRVKNVLLNPYRSRFLDVLREMGGQIDIQELPEQCGEKGADIVASPSRLTGISIPPEWIPGLIDELPILSVAGAMAKGELSFRGAAELRVKESDRIQAMAENLRKCGFSLSEFEDGMTIQGKPDFMPPDNCSLESYLDHRVIMSFEILWRAAGVRNEALFQDKKWVNTSFPQFYELLDEVSA